MNKLIRQIPENFKNLDIIGDIHGELDFLNKLLNVLGYDTDGYHCEGRKIVFLGDFVDRGPKSASTVKKIKKMIENGNAIAILGNHELNTLNLDSKPGSGWFFESILKDKKEHKYEPCEKINESDRQFVLDFLNSLPIAYEGDDLRLIHACWHEESIEKLRELKVVDVKKEYHYCLTQINEKLENSVEYQLYLQERSQWGSRLSEKECKVPFLDGWAQVNNKRQMNHPFKVLTSGVERIRENREPFFVQKWRFTERCAWWDSYSDSKPVIIGHYWRRFSGKEGIVEGEESLFKEIDPLSYFGKKSNVFCIDYSIGLMFEKRHGERSEQLHLAAFRWPEEKIVLDNGMVFDVNNKLLIKNGAKIGTKMKNL